MSVAAVAMLIGTSASAQLGKGDQKCIDQYNNKLRLVGQQAGKDYRSCVKNAGKGTEPNPDGCVTADTPGKIAGKEGKVNDLFVAGGKCDLMPAAPIQQGAATGNTAMVDESQGLVRDVFGDPIAGTVTPGKGEAKCQDAVYKRAEQLFTEKLKDFRKCKKDGMKNNAITDSTTLQTACLPVTGIPDPKGKIGKKKQKLLDDANAKCAAPISISSTFQGKCGSSGSTAALGACIEALVECHVCKALNAADGLSTNCDLFDNGLADGSCVNIVNHKCVLAPAPASQLQIHIEALPVPLTFGLVGALDIGADGNFGTCSIQTLDPVTIPMIGVVCISGSSSCPTGTRWCGPGPGPALGIDIQSDGNIGACTSNADCDAQAPAACIGEYGAGYVPLGNGACTGFCSGGAGSACSTDAQCASLGEDACNGPDPIGVNGNICQVNCINTAAHGPSDPGDIQCNLGSNLNVETAAPCDGTDITIVVGSTCIPESSQEASSHIDDANFMAGHVVPPVPNVNDLTGAPVICATLDTSTTTGFAGVGVVNFFGSALGDLAVGLKATCM